MALFAACGATCCGVLHLLPHLAKLLYDCEIKLPQLPNCLIAFIRAYPVWRLNYAVDNKTSTIINNNIGNYLMSIELMWAINFERL